MSDKKSLSKSTTQAAPGFVVIGAMRAGTTTIYEMLRQTNLVSVPRMKETDFFLAKKYSRGLGWLMEQYDDLSKPIFDLSPNYTRCRTFKGVPERIYETNPNAKLIYILRDPIKRALSEYRHGLAMGLDLPAPDKLYQDGDPGYDCSRYFEQLQPYLKLWSMDDIHIVEFEDLVADQWGTLSKLFKDLGLPEIPNGQDDVHTNSADDLQRMPSWWGGLRNQPAVEWVRSKTPRDTVTFLKSVFFRGNAKDLKAVKFPPHTIEAIRESLVDDVEALRNLTGRSFARWDI